MIPKRKEQSIETLRGIAIILMVAGHVIGRNADYGLKVDEDSFWRYFNYLFKYIRMPLFTAISGYVYALKPVSRETIDKFLKGKTRRIILPLLVVSSLQYTFQAIIPYVNYPTNLNDIWRIYFFSYGHFWFLQALFLVFLTTVLIERFNLLSNFKSWILIFSFSAIIYAAWDPLGHIKLFSLMKYLFLLVFFLLGIGIKRFGHILFTRKIVIIVSIIFVLIYTVYLNLMGSYLLSQVYVIRILQISIGVSALLLLFHFRRANKYLGWLGYYSYGIYLFHIFGTGFTTVITKTGGIHSNLLKFTLGIFFGLGFPIIMEYFILKNNLLRHLMLGLRMFRSKPKTDLRLANS